MKKKEWVNSDFPQARREDLVIQAMPDETLVYDLKTHQAHCLNRTAASIWNHCDGKKSAADIANLVASEHETSLPPEVVGYTLGQLTKANLLQKGSFHMPKEHRLRRRDVIQMLGKAALVSAPLVVSIVAPNSAAAASCLTNVMNMDACPAGTIGVLCHSCMGAHVCMPDAMSPTGVSCGMA